MLQRLRLFGNDEELAIEVVMLRQRWCAAVAQVARPALRPSDFIELDT